MKRYRVIAGDFDTRVISLESEQDHWEEEVKIQHRQNQQRVVDRLIYQYGEENIAQKLQNFVELGVKPFSVMAYHNRFLEQARRAFTNGQYYPALVAACALGERILNHLVLELRDYYTNFSSYRKVHRKKSFDNWPLVIDTLQEWGVLTTLAANNFRLLHNQRNHAIHFNRETEPNDRALALQSVQCIQQIVESQFGIGALPWLFWIPGECYVKYEYEDNPFVRLAYMPSSVLLGYKHTVATAFPWSFNDAEDYSTAMITDQEYEQLRIEHRDIAHRN